MELDLFSCVLSYDDDDTFLGLRSVNLKKYSTRDIPRCEYAGPNRRFCLTTPFFSARKPNYFANVSTFNRWNLQVKEHLSCVKQEATSISIVHLPYANLCQGTPAAYIVSWSLLKTSFPTLPSETASSAISFSPLLSSSINQHNSRKRGLSLPFLTLCLLCSRTSRTFPQLISLPYAPALNLH